MAAARPFGAATAAIALSLAMIAGTLAPRRVEAVASRTATAPPTPGPLGSKPWGGEARAADRATERRVRGAIRSDPFLTLAAPRVKVTSRRGVVRLVGRVATAKERSSIVFKASQNPSGRIDDRVSIGDDPEGTMQ